MNRIVFALCMLSMIAGCSRKTIPSNTPRRQEPGSTAIIVDPPSRGTEVIKPPLVKKDSVATAKEATKATVALPLVVVDGMGNIITPKDKLPEEIAAKLDYRSIGRAFTPNQRTNLVYRYKMVPPKILYVPDQYISTSAKGKYIVYRKKFWYWQKEDGLFYLDEAYYR